MVFGFNNYAGISNFKAFFVTVFENRENKFGFLCFFILENRDNTQKDTSF